MPVLGNHDIQNKSGKDFQKPFQDYHSLFNLPGDEVNYCFTYMNVRFIGIFSGCAEAAAKTDQVKYRAGSPEYKWLEGKLSKAGKDEKSEMGHRMDALSGLFFRMEQRVKMER